MRGLKQDNLWQSVALYLRQGDLFYRGEVGMTENIRWVECHREGAVSNTAGTSTVLGNAFVFGDEAVARVEAEAPHLRADPNYQSDFGRVHAAAWYGKLQFGSFWTTATDGQAKIIRITSAEVLSLGQSEAPKPTWGTSLRGLFLWQPPHTPGRVPGATEPGGGA